MENRMSLSPAKASRASGVWSKPKADAPFVCLEPWIGRCDNVGFDGELKDKYGEQHLKAGETFQAGYTITIGE